MIIQTGDPTVTGKYAVYVAGDVVATHIRFWLIGTGWLDNLREPLPEGAAIDAWIGPLPLRPQPGFKMPGDAQWSPDEIARMKKQDAAPLEFNGPILEYDL